MRKIASPHGQTRRARVFALWKFIFFLLLLSAQTRANNGHLQNTVTLTERNVPINRVLKKIQRQTGYTYFAPITLLNKAKNISIDVKDVSLTVALDKIFESQPLTYKIVQRVIIVQEKTEQSANIINEAAGPVDEVRGRVTNAEGEPIEGANVMVKGTKKVVTTNRNGEYIINGVVEGTELEVSFIGYEKRIIIAKSGIVVKTSLAIISKELDIAIVQAYGTTTRRLNIGNIAKVTADEISKQPVSNPLAALSGRVPGMIITQSSGVPGGSFKIEIRGRSSLDLSLTRNDPLIIIDGVPFEQGNVSTNQILSFANNPKAASDGTGLSPLNNLNTQDIESIEVLKDADATAIYGSRGANGVIIITTKKGRSGKTTANASIYSGFSNIGRSAEMLDTKAYLQIRREAFLNDGTTPTISNAPDLLVWDTTRYTNFKDEFIGGTAATLNAQLSLSGGSSNTQFRISTGYNKETTVFPGDYFDRRISSSININHTSSDRKFLANLVTNYSVDNNRLGGGYDLTSYINLPPNIRLRDSARNLNWGEGNTYFSNSNPNFNNPYAELLKQYESINENLVSNLELTFKPISNLSITSSFGYNTFNSEETSSTPKKAIDRAYATLASARFANSNSKNWIIEPRIEYIHRSKSWNIKLLAGATFQERINKSESITGNNYTNDLLLNSIAAAGAISGRNTYTQYRYTAFYGRINFAFENKYLFNITGRRDGSSRFGPSNRFANFGSLGIGYLFSENKFIADLLPIVSYGKIRASYGISGNDQIGDYNYLDLYNSYSTQYQGTPTLFTARLYNPDYKWERNRKLEVGIEINLLKDKIAFSSSYYQHRSKNQLIKYSLPIITGFISVTSNREALIQNSGWEFILSTKNITNGNFNWATSLGLTIPKNKLISFPNLSTSPYTRTLVEGQPLSVIYGYKFTGVDPNTGLYTFEDANKDGQLTPVTDYQVLGNSDPKFYGFFRNTLSFRGFEFDMFLDVRKQLGLNYLNYQGSSVPPGVFSYNQPKVVLDRWQKAGDMTSIQKVSASGSSPTSRLLNTLTSSNALFSDASFVRVKTLSLSYKISASVSEKISISSCRIFINVQNLYTFSNYKGADPETQNIYQLPPLRTIVFGLHLTL